MIAAHAIVQAGPTSLIMRLGGRHAVECATNHMINGVLQGSGGDQAPIRRSKPSWTALAISVPSAVYMRPFAKPRAPDADGELQS